MRPRPFDPAEPGTSEVAWLTDRRWDEVPVLTADDLAAQRLIVLAAHPDDETLGVGALLTDLAAAGASIEVVLATDGAASHPRSQLWTSERLAEVRAAEMRHALSVLAPDARPHALGLPDGTLATVDDLLDRVRAVLPPTDSRSELVLAPHPHDGHADHDRLGEVAAELATERGARLWFYPIWLWHWAEPDEWPWQHTALVAPSAQALHAKAQAVAAHHSQVEPLSPLPGDEVLLPAHVLARFARVVETLIAPDEAARSEAIENLTDITDSTDTTDSARRRARGESFEAMFDDGDDPWASTSWYERRKHALTAAVRTREDYDHIVEIGCATGALTVHLASLARRVTALDGSARALDVARRRGLPAVTWQRAEVPYDLGVVADASADLVVVSEVAYFLTGAEWLALLRQVRRMLAPGGEVVLVDWREGSTDLPLDGDLVHAQAGTVLADLGHRLGYRDDSARIDVWGGSPLTPQEQS